MLRKSCAWELSRLECAEWPALGHSISLLSCSKKALIAWTRR